MDSAASGDYDVVVTLGVMLATFTQNSGKAITATSTVDGYTVAQVVKAQRNLGLLQ